MSTAGAMSGRRFYRDADRAVLGGVCAGIADYLGFKLRMTRFLAFVAFLMAMPIAVAVYLAAVFLVPSVSRKDNGDVFRKPVSARRCKRKERVAEEPAPRVRPSTVIDKKCVELESRLRTIEKHVTSSQFQLNQELERL